MAKRKSKDGSLRNLETRIRLVKDEAYQLAERIQQRAIGQPRDSVPACDAGTAALIIQIAEHKSQFVPKAAQQKQRQAFERKIKEREEALTLELKTFVPLTESYDSAIVANKLCRDAAADIDVFMRTFIARWDKAALAAWVKARAMN